MNVFTKCVADAEKMYPVHPSVANFFRMMEAVEDIPERKPEWDVRKPYFPWEGRHEIDKAKVYDAEFAELCGEKEIRAEKFRKTHDMRKKSKDDRPEDRKRNKKNRNRKIHRTSGMVETRVMRDRIVAEMDKFANADMIPDAELYVGYNTVQRIMYNADKRMREIRAEVTDRDDATVDTYDDSYVVLWGDGGFQYQYPDDYYWWRDTWKFYEHMIQKYGMEYANKYAKGEC